MMSAPTTAKQIWIFRSFGREMKYSSWLRPSQDPVRAVSLCSRSENSVRQRMKQIPETEPKTIRRTNQCIEKNPP